MIDLLDTVTENWLHDSTIAKIAARKTSMILEFLYYKKSAAKLVINFLRNEGTLEQENISDFVGKEIYRLKLHKRNLGNELEIIASDNKSLTIFYDSIEYHETSI